MYVKCACTYMYVCIYVCMYACITEYIPHTHKIRCVPYLSDVEWDLGTIAKQEPRFIIKWGFDVTPAL